MKALGLIETKGLVAAIESADAMLKAADVSLLDKSLVGAGLVTITVTGEVSAVQASVDAAVAAVNRLDGGTLVSKNVIPRPYAELECVINTKVSSDEKVKVSSDKKASDEKVKAGSSEEKIIKKEQLKKSDSLKKTDDFDTESTVSKKEESSGKSSKDEAPAFSSSQLKKMNVGELKRLARTFDYFPIARKDIKHALKKELVKAILKAFKQEEE